MGKSRGWIPSSTVVSEPIFFFSKKTEVRRQTRDMVVRHQTRDMVQLVERLPRVQTGLGLKLRAK